jgi:inosine-uridine nucleoside N-ribohydrolase
MRIFFLCILFATGFASCKEKPGPVAVILDTDIAPDYDDIGALAMLHAFADKGEAKILVTVSCNAFETTAPTLSVINTYFNRAAIPIGIVKTDSPNYACPRLWAHGIIAKYPHAVKSNDDAMEAVQLYRKILSAQPDTSVTIVSIGMLTNLANLLNSKPDEYSGGDGLQLVKRKVNRLVAMAGGIDSTGNSGYEWNVMADIPAAQKVFNDWPSPVTLSGFEIGVNIFTGMKLINNEAIKNSPVKDAYHISLNYDGSTIGRYSWDQTAVLIAVRGIESYFNYRRLNLAIKDDGKDTVIAGNKITYTTSQQKPEAIGNLMEELMMHEPGRKPLNFAKNYFPDRMVIFCLYNKHCISRRLQLAMP